MYFRLDLKVLILNQFLQGEMIATLLLVQLQMLVVYIPCKPHSGKTKGRPTLLRHCSSEHSISLEI